MPSTTTYQPGDVVLVAFPFTGGAGAKRRPALVLNDDGGPDLLLARVTTRIYTTPFDVLVADWKPAGLVAPSVARLHKLATLERVLVERRLGSLSGADRQQVATTLRTVFASWG